MHIEGGHHMCAYSAHLHCSGTTDSTTAQNKLSPAWLDPHSEQLLGSEQTDSLALCVHPLAHHAQQVSAPLSNSKHHQAIPHVLLSAEGSQSTT
eukprot:1301783-Amphidinium_carterae.1